MRGNRTGEIATCGYRHGLSPRVRGNPLAGLQQSAVPNEGSIPACAGEPLSLHSRAVGDPVYPRVCGGTWSWPGCWWSSAGLSPRVRGNRCGQGRRPGPLRSIPACAGNRHRPAPAPERARSIPACAGEPYSPGGTSCTWRVYPRVCGGTISSKGGFKFVRGLSPRVRGNPVGQKQLDRVGRSIPACAGEPRGGRGL